MAKANVAANMSKEAFHLPEGSHFWDGTPFDPAQGGLVRTPDGALYSLADPDCVPDNGYCNSPGKKDDRTVARNRIAEVVLGKMVPPQGHTDGFEIEFSTLSRDDGHLAPIAKVDGGFSGALGKVPRTTLELHDFSIEVSTPIARNPRQLRDYVIKAAGNVVDAAHQDKLLAVPLETVGQRRLGQKDLNPHKYPKFMHEFATDITGFPFDEIFAIYAAQGLRGTRESLEVTAKAGYYMQFANLLLSPASMSGPFYAGRHKMASEDWPEFTAKQKAHMEKMNLVSDDFYGEYVSWRALLRRAGSVNGGVWREQPPRTEKAYYAAAHRGLREKQFFTIDRFMVEHGDRIRHTLGAFENSSWGNVGDLDKIVAQMIIGNAIYSSVEHMVANGIRPEEEFPSIFGLVKQGSRALTLANRYNLAIHREGMDATYRSRPIHSFGEKLLDLATYKGLSEVPRWAMGDFLSSYVSNQRMRENLRKWCHSQQLPPSMNAFHDTGIGIPAIYMQEIYNYYRNAHPKLPEEEIIRLCELDRAEAFVRHVERVVEAKRFKHDER